MASQESVARIQNPLADKREEFFKSNYGLVVAIAGRYAPRSDLTLDIAQQSYLEFLDYERKKVLDYEKDAKPILCQITKNVALAHWRRYRLESGKGLLIVAERLQEIQRANEEKYSDTFIADHIVTLKSCVEELPDGDKELLDEYYVQSIPLKTIAERHNMTYEALRQHFVRLRIKLKKCINRTLRDHEHKSN